MRKFCGATIDKVGDRSVSKGAEIDSVLLATLTGRFEFDDDDDNRTIVPGSIDYGTNHLTWSEESFDTVSSGTIDTTTQTIPNNLAGLSFKVPTASKVRCNFHHRPAGVNATLKDFRAQVWSISSLPSGRTNGSWTLRADLSFTSGSDTTSWTSSTLITTSDVPAGHLVILAVGLDSESITRPVHLSFQGSLCLED